MNTFSLPRPLRTLFTVATLLLIASVRAHAQTGCVNGADPTNCAPEIDASLASSGFALITGAIFLIRGRRKR
jgi:hypothetical protein